MVRGDEPIVLLLGDSISMGYAPLVQARLVGRARVIRPQLDGRDENCEGTTHGVASLERWLAAAGEPHVIVFNFGLHDLKHLDPASGAPSQDPSHPRQAPPQVYRQQLRQIAERLMQTRAHLFFATTTPVPAGGVRPFRRVGDPLLYNGLARQVVEPLGIPVIDLWAVANDHLADWQQPVNVHFRAEGSQGLADAVANAVLPYLDQPPPVRQVKPWEAEPGLVARLNRGDEVNYDEAAVPTYQLPPLFPQLAAGDPTPEAWQRQRDVLLESFRETIYGRVPAPAARLQIQYATTHREPELCAGTVEGRAFELTVSAVDDAGAPRSFSFPFFLYLPRGRTAPVPVFLFIHNRERPDLVGLTIHPDGFLPIELLVEYGFGVAVFHTSDVEPDRADGRAEGIRGWIDRWAGPTSTTSDDWGAISAWAWAASRILDYLETDAAVAADRVCVVGHSRGGKTALWAAAQDSRFAAAISNDSGCAGAALSRRQFGERIGRIGSVFPYWFCTAFRQYAEREPELPVDQHQLLALLAPRPLYVASAGDDLWADPRGEYLALVAAAPAFHWAGTEALDSPQMPALGAAVARGRTAYHVRPGPHDLTEGDWSRFAEFVARQFIH